jgi:cell division cycle 20-like protein 1 (cofactor of APC complex)
MGDSDRYIPQRISAAAFSSYDPSSPTSPQRSGAGGGWRDAALRQSYARLGRPDAFGSASDKSTFVQRSILQLELLNASADATDATESSFALEDADEHRVPERATAASGRFDRPAILVNAEPRVASAGEDGSAVLLRRSSLGGAENAENVGHTGPARAGGWTATLNAGRSPRNAPLGSVPARLLRFSASSPDVLRGGGGFGSPSSPLLRPGASAATMSPGSTALLAAVRPRRRICRVPYRVLDAPGLADDFYLNLIDWSSQNVLLVGLKGDVYMWDGFTTTVSKLATMEGGQVATSVTWSARGAHAALGTENGIVQIYDATACKLVRTLRGHTQRVGSMAWAGHLLATSGRDKSVLLRDMRAPEDSCATLRGHTQEVCGLQWSLDWSLLCSGGNDNKVFVWSAAKLSDRSLTSSVATAPTSHAALYRFSGHTAAVKALAWSPHQPGLLVSGGGTQDKTLRFWNTNTGVQTGVVDTGSQVTQVAWSPRNAQLVSCHGYSTNHVVVWSWPTMTPLATMTGHTSRVLYMAMSPDGTSICTGAGDETLRFWNTFGGSGEGEGEGEGEDGAAAALGGLVGPGSEPYGIPKVGIRNLMAGGGSSLDVR